jgi:hypothetical protein
MKNDPQPALVDLDAGSEASSALLDAARSDELLPLLRATRSALAAAMVFGPLTTVAQCAARLQVTAEAVDALLKSHPEVSTSDALRDQAAKGLAKAKVVQLAGRRSKRSAG